MNYTKTMVFIMFTTVSNIREFGSWVMIKDQIESPMRCKQWKLEKCQLKGFTNVKTGTNPGAVKYTFISLFHAYSSFIQVKRKFHKIYIEIHRIVATTHIDNNFNANIGRS